MSLESLTFKDELEQIDQARQTLLNTVSDFEAFILSPKAFDDDVEFERKLMAVQKSVVMVAELTVTPSEQVELIRKMAMAQEQPITPQPETEQATLEKYIPETAFTLPKALVSFAAIVASAIAVEKTLLPPSALLGVVAAVLTFAFASQLKQLIQAFLERKPEAEEEETLKLEDIEKISSLFSQIRSKYVSAYFLIRWQGRPEEPIPEAFEGLGMDKLLLNRGEYLRRTLPHEFMDIIGRIVNACERSIWQRKQLVISAIVQSSTAMMVQR